MRLVRFGHRMVDLASGVVNAGALVVPLSPIESRLLRYLAERVGVLVSREELLAEVWSYRPGVVTRTIDNTVRRLRIKVEDNPSDPRFLQSVYARGLRLEGVEVLEQAPSPHLSPLVGRDESIVRVLAALRSERIVTLIGPAGIGKTRLASEVASRSGFEVLELPCASVRSTEDLDHRLLVALGVTERLITSLRERGPLLLLLDECDQAAQVVSERVRSWLIEAPNLRVLVTSRVMLKLSTEHMFIIDPLPVELAVELFRDRLVHRDPRFPIDELSVQRVVEKLDGLPLAIELAAARAPLLGLDRLESLLAAPLDVLEARGQSMAGALERSWRLCSEEDRRILSMLSVFVSTFDLDDLVAITDSSPFDALRAVESLAEQSLLSLVEGPQVRYRLLATIRERARKDLPSDDAVHLRCARWFARLGVPELIERAYVDFSLRAKIRLAIPDLERSLDILLPIDPEAAAQCVYVTVWWLAREGAKGQGLDFAARLTVTPRSERVRMGIASEQAVLLTAAALFEKAQEVIAEAIPFCTDPRDLLMLYTSLASTWRNRGRLVEAVAALDAAEPYLSSGRGAVARYLFVRAVLSPDDEAEQLLTASLRAAQACGDRLLKAITVTELAERTFVRNGDWAAARRMYLDALSGLGPESDWRYMRLPVRQILTQIGRLEQLVGNLDAAETYLEQAFDLSTGDTPLLARLLLARVWSQGGQHEEALALVEPVTGGVLSPAAEMLALAYIVHVECLIRADRWTPAPPLLERAKGLLEQGKWRYLQSELLDLCGIVERNEGHFDAAASLDKTMFGTARRHALRSLLASHEGDRVRAHAELTLAQTQMEALGLGPQSDAALWSERAKNALCQG